MSSSNSIHQSSSAIHSFIFRAVDIPPRRRGPRRGPRLGKSRRSSRPRNDAGNPGSPEIEIPGISPTELGGKPNPRRFPSGIPLANNPSRPPGHSVIEPLLGRKCFFGPHRDRTSAWVGGGSFRKLDSQTRFANSISQTRFASCGRPRFANSLPPKKANIQEYRTSFPNGENFCKSFAIARRPASVFA